MGLGKVKTEHSGPRDMSRKDGNWGFTEEAKEWASRARRRDEVADLRRELADHGASADASDGLTQLWLDRWPQCRPIGHELRDSARDNWLRFHSLPESKRHAETDEEYAEILHRHHAVIDELRASSSSSEELIVITVEWSLNDEIETRPPELEESF